MKLKRIVKLKLLLIIFVKCFRPSLIRTCTLRLLRVNIMQILFRKYYYSIYLFILFFIFKLIMLMRVVRDDVAYI